MQEDRHQVEHIFVEQHPLKVEQVLKAGHCSINYGTVPQFVEQLLLNLEQVQ